MTARFHHWANQPPGPSDTGPLLSMFGDVRLLFNATDYLYDHITGQKASNNGPSNLVLSDNICGRGISFGSLNSSAGFLWSNRSTAAVPNHTFFGILTPKAGGGSSQVIIGNVSSNGGVYVTIGTAGTSISVTKGAIITYITHTVALGVPIAFITSHREDTDEWWIMTRSLLDGSTSTSTGTNTNSATTGNGTYAVGGWNSGSTVSSNSPIYMAGMSFSFTPQALGYAFLSDPWQVFGPLIYNNAPAASPSSLIKTWNGIAQASVKTGNSIANASIKTVNSIANV